jgi:hypothetical protein
MWLGCKIEVLSAEGPDNCSIRARLLLCSYEELGFKIAGAGESRGSAVLFTFEQELLFSCRENCGVLERILFINAWSSSLEKESSGVVDSQRVDLGTDVA